MRMVFHGVSDDIGNFMKFSVVHLPERMEYTPLDRFQPVIYMGNGSVFDDIGGVFYEMGRHHFTQSTGLFVP